MSGALDPREFRQALGQFATGITLVTTRAPQGEPRGFTANSFTSVSLDPPLISVCIAKTAASYAIFCEADAFSVNVLSEDQRDASNIFATQRADKFDAVAWHASPSNMPLIDNALACFDCSRHSVVEAGDHGILIGKVRSLTSKMAVR